MTGDYGTPSPGSFFPNQGSCPNCGYCDHCGRSNKPQPTTRFFGSSPRVLKEVITDPEHIARIRDLLDSLDDEPDMEFPRGGN